jgi:hypothetical protein
MALQILSNFFGHTPSFLIRKPTTIHRINNRDYYKEPAAGTYDE